VFLSFAMFGKGQIGSDIKPRDVRMDGKAFAKVIKEASLMGKALDPTRVDLCFTKCTDKVTKRMNFKQFNAALAACAHARSMDVDTFISAVAATEPHVSGTVTCHVKWHDDRSTYTGVYAQGGPSTVDKHVELKNLVDRAAQDATRRRTSTVPSWAS
jgi:hypothetical protein